MEGIQGSVVDLPSFVEECIVSCQEKIGTLMDSMDLKLEGILDDLRMVKQALRSGVTEERAPSKVKTQIQSHLRVYEVLRS